MAELAFKDLYVARLGLRLPAAGAAAVALHAHRRAFRAGRQLSAVMPAGSGFGGIVFGLFIRRQGPMDLVVGKAVSKYRATVIEDPGIGLAWIWPQHSPDHLPIHR